MAPAHVFVHNCLLAQLASVTMLVGYCVYVSCTRICMRARTCAFMCRVWVCVMFICIFLRFPALNLTFNAGFVQIGGRVQKSLLTRLSLDNNNSNNLSTEAEIISQMVLTRDAYSLFFMPLGNSDEFLWAFIMRADHAHYTQLATLSQTDLFQYVLARVRTLYHPLKRLIENHPLSDASPLHVTGYHYHAPDKLLPLFRDGHVSAQKFEPVILLGDAAHSMTPMQGEGGNTAIEDGVRVGMALGTSVRINFCVCILHDPYVRRGRAVVMGMACLLGCPCVCICTCLRVCVCAGASACADVHAHVRVRACAGACVCMHMYVCMRVCKIYIFLF